MWYDFTQRRWGVQMQSFSLSPAELSFVSQYGQMIDDIISDLTDLHRQISITIYNNLRRSEDNIISRISPLANFTQDIEYDLRSIMHQMYDLRYSGLPAPIINFEGEPVPVLLTVIERSKFDGTLASLGYLTSAGYAIADTDQAIRILSGPLTKFLAVRAMQTTNTAASAQTPNVTVTNNADGWQIVYSPYYQSTEKGFGGPSSPVSGYLNPGIFRFGIKKTGLPQWDTSSWTIPTSTNIYVPLP